MSSLVQFPSGVLWSGSHTWSPGWSPGGLLLYVGYQSFSSVGISGVRLFHGTGLGRAMMGPAGWVRCIEPMLPPMTSSAGLNLCSRGVERYASSALWGSLVFFSMFFTVWTVCSITPFAWGYFELVVIWVNPYWSANLARSAVMNCGPLSEINLSGIPCLANMGFRWWLDSRATSAYLEK